MCSGKGFGAPLLSYLLPSARLIILDANGDMDMGHVQVWPNICFVHVDVFASACVKAIRVRWPRRNGTLMVTLTAVSHPSPRAREPRL